VSATRWGEIWRHDGGITQVPSALEQDPPTQNPESQSQSVEQCFGAHPPTVAVVEQVKLAGQPVWLQGSAWQPCASAPVPPTAHWNPLGQVYPALQGCGAQP
jgi:hypothetical protein